MTAPAAIAQASARQQKAASPTNRSTTNSVNGRVMKRAPSVTELTAGSR